MTTSPAAQRGGASAIETVTLRSGRQRLSVLPGLGASIAAWDLEWRGAWTPLMRPWGGADDLYTTACFPLVPWSNRITEGGFMHKDLHYPVLQNRAGENYPIHGDGWLQAWRVAEQSDRHIVLALDSAQYDGDPYTYSATQTLTLNQDGLTINLQVTNRGTEELPFGLGLHPYFPRNAETRLQSHADGVWLCGADPIPTGHTRDFPATFDYNRFAPVEFPIDGPLIDNCFTGWDGLSHIDYPDRGLRLSMQMEDCKGYSLMYRPPGLDYFCLEPITHPIDAFHMPGRDGLVNLAPDASMRLLTHFIVSEI